MASCDDPRDSYLPASFKGARFEVESSADEFGRRVAEYEYPLSNVNGVKDMGRKIRRFSVTGYIVGNNHVARAAACILAAETPGPGPLIHPALGPQIVACVSLKVSYEYKEAAGRARLEWDFIEGLESNAPFLIGMAIGALFHSGSRAVARSYDGAKGRWSGTAAQTSATTRVSQQLKSRLVKQDLATSPTAVQQPRSNIAKARQIVSLGVAFEAGAQAARIDAESEEALFDAQSLLDRGLYSSTVYRDFEEAADPIVNGTAQIRQNFTDALPKLRAFNADVVAEHHATPEIEPLAVTARLSVARDYGLTALQSDFATVGEALGHLDFVRGVYDEEELIASRQCFDALILDISAARADISRSLLDMGIRLPGIVTYDAKGEWPSLVAAQNIYSDGKRFSDLENYNPGSNPFRMARNLIGPADAGANR